MFERFSPNRRVGVLAFDGVVLGDLAVPCEVFGRAGYEVRVCSDQRRVKAQHLTITPPFRLRSLSRAHTIIVPGIDELNRPIPVSVVRALQASAERGTRIASICTGAFVLAAAGLLDGRRATTHWLAAPELMRRYPSIEVDADVLYLDDEDVLTSAGAAAAFDLCLHLIRTDLGAEVAARIARACVMPLERAGGQAQFIEYEAPLNRGTLVPLLEWIERNMDADLSLAALARRVALSERTLSRHFRKQTGTTPGKWVARARVRSAQRLLETSTLSVEQIAVEVGFGSAQVMRSCFRRVTRTSPQAHRRTFGAA